MTGHKSRQSGSAQSTRKYGFRTESLICPLNSHDISRDVSDISPHIRDLKIANADLLTVFENLENMLEMQFTELNTEMESDKASIPHHHKLDIMEPLLCKISKNALNRIYEQYKESSDLNLGDSCTGAFTRSFGLPCKHVIKEKIQQSEKLQLNDVHPQWHLDVNPLSLKQTTEISTNEPALTPRKRKLEEIKERLYKNDGNAPVLL